MSNNRDAGIDLLRILCCILVVAIHVTPLATGANDVTALLIQSFVRVGLPVFFIISGMYLLNTKIDSIFNFYKKRVSVLIVPFIVYSLIHFLTLNIQSGDVAPYSLLKSYLLALSSSTGIAGHLWFVYTLLGLYLISPLLSYFISGINSKNAMSALAFMLFLRGFSQYIRPYTPYIEIPDLAVWLLYFMIGGVLYKLPKMNPYTTGLIILLSYFSTVFLSYCQLSGVITSNIGVYDTGLNIYVFAIALCIFFKDIKINVSPAVSKTLSFISTGTYGAYLIHILVLTEISRNFNLFWSNGNVAIYSVLITIIVFLISLIFALVINKLIVNHILNFILKSSKKTTETPSTH
ncbi:TPA: acyltransferase [Citrobacter freundii]|nr:acyltransferase [Citrobacter freundii]